MRYQSDLSSRKTGSSLPGILAFATIGLIFVGCWLMFTAVSTQPHQPAELDPAPLATPTAASKTIQGDYAYYWVANFVRAHPEFGKITSSTDEPDWAKGKRQRITTSSGDNLLFYEKGGGLVAVYRDTPDGRKLAWGSYEAE